MALKRTATRTSTSTPRPTVLSDEIYERIKSKILNHEIIPGSRVNIDSLSVQLSVSQTPIREALARLESEGLIEKQPLKGYKASQLLSVKELKDLFQYRLLTEPWAAEQAAKAIDKAGKSELKSEIQRAKSAMKFSGDGNFKALTEHDTRFHTLISGLSGNTFVADSYARTHCHLHLFRLYMASKLQLIQGESRAAVVQDLFQQYYQSGSGQRAVEEHIEIANAILENNPKAARIAMHSHIENSLIRFAPRATAKE